MSPPGGCIRGHRVAGAEQQRAGESGYARRRDESGDPTGLPTNANAQALATQVSDTIGVVVMDVSDASSARW